MLCAEKPRKNAQNCEVQIKEKIKSDFHEKKLRDTDGDINDQRDHKPF